MLDTRLSPHSVLESHRDQHLLLSCACRALVCPSPSLHPQPPLRVPCLVPGTPHSVTQGRPGHWAPCPVPMGQCHGEAHEQPGPWAPTPFLPPALSLCPRRAAQLLHPVFATLSMPRCREARPSKLRGRPVGRWPAVQPGDRGEGHLPTLKGCFKKRNKNLGVFASWKEIDGFN